MSKYEHELDDELLSAYLDDELSAEERAAVEARLAADPDAQQMLHQLRAVSQAVQGLPQEAVGYDLRDSILRRAAQQSDVGSMATSAARERQPSASNGAPAETHDTDPTLTIGRTRRGWLWASLAVAATLLIMVFQSEPEQGKDLPALAQRNDRVAKDQAPPGRAGGDQLAFRALKEPAEPAAAPIGELETTTPDARGERNWDFAEDSRGTPLPSSGARSSVDTLASSTESEMAAAPLAPTNQPSDTLGDESAPSAAETAGAATGTSSPELLTAKPPGAEMARDASGKLADAPAASAPVAADENQIAESQLVVVRVLAKRTALEGKAFDRLLERNGIDVEPDAPRDNVSQLDAYGSRVRRLTAQSKDKPVAAVEQAAEEPEGTNAELDLLFVQAAPAAIASCLKSLHEDTANYVAVAVDDATALNEGITLDAGATAFYSTEAGQQPLPKKRSVELGWTKYSRGDVPQQEESLGRAKLNLSYGLATQSDSYSAGRGIGGGLRGSRLEQLQQDSEAAYNKSPHASNRGWARRSVSLGLEETAARELATRGGAAGRTQTAPSSEPQKLGDLQRELKAPARQSDETQHVLFVLMPQDEPAPSPASDNRAE